MWISQIKQYNMRILRILLISLPFFVFGQADTAFSLPYQLDTPVRQLKVDDALKEISGLSMSPNEEFLIAIQDELGSLFYLDKQTGEIVKEVSFWKEGDYEGIELVGDDIYVVKNTGTLYCISNAGKEDQEVTKYNGFLSSDDNIEGLTYWPQENKLLLASKAQAHPKSDGCQQRAIYAFDLDSAEMIPTPFMEMKRSKVDHYMEYEHHCSGECKICSLFDEDKNDFKLSPAAVAIHPIDEQVYILSANGNLLIVVSMNGEIQLITKLPKKLHRQPEGLCFDAAGNMYISNEERKEHEANVVVYTYERSRDRG